MLLFGGLLLSHAILNHIGIKLVPWLNDFSAWYHIAVVVVIVALLTAHGRQPVHFLAVRHSTDGFRYPYSFLIGCSWRSGRSWVTTLPHM